MKENHCKELCTPKNIVHARELCELLHRCFEVEYKHKCTCSSIFQCANVEHLSRDIYMYITYMYVSDLSDVLVIITTSCKLINLIKYNCVTVSCVIVSQNAM